MFILIIRSDSTAPDWCEPERYVGPFATDAAAKAFARNELHDYESGQMVFLRDPYDDQA